MPPPYDRIKFTDSDAAILAACAQDIADWRFRNPTRQEFDAMMGTFLTVPMVINEIGEIDFAYSKLYRIAENEPPILKAPPPEGIKVG